MNEEKVKQVIIAINENNGLNAFDDVSLAKLLSMLNPKELDLLECRAYSELGGTRGYIRISNIRPLVENYVLRDLYRIKTSDTYHEFIDNLKLGKQDEVIKKISNKGLNDLVKYFSYPANENKPELLSGFEKITRMLTKEIKLRDEQNKHQFA